MKLHLLLLAPLCVFVSLISQAQAPRSNHVVVVTLENHSYEQVIGNVKDEPAMWTLKPVEIFIQLFPTEAPQYLEPLLQKILFTIIFD